MILLDVVMPGMDGFETASHIKRRPKTRDVPIIFLTAASAEAHHAFRGYAAGAVDYISKPFDPWVLRAKVAVFVELYAKNQQLQEQAELLRSQLGAGPALERGAARQALPAPSGPATPRRDVPPAGPPVRPPAKRRRPRPRTPPQAAAPAGDTQPLLLELSSRLAAVEDLVGVLGRPARGQRRRRTGRLRRPARAPGGAAPGRPGRPPRRLASPWMGWLALGWLALGWLAPGQLAPSGIGRQPSPAT